MCNLNSEGDLAAVSFSVYIDVFSQKTFDHSSRVPTLHLGSFVFSWLKMNRYNEGRGYFHRSIYFKGHVRLKDNGFCKGKGMFLYSAVSSPWDCSKRFTLHSQQTCSFHCHFDFSGKHSAMLELLREDYSFRYSPLSVARYSFTQLSELWQRGKSKIAKASKWQQEDSNPGCLN